MRARPNLVQIVILAAVQMLLVLGAWWSLGLGWRTPPEQRADAPATARTAMERLAELYAGAAFRSVITADYAALTELVRRATAWPEVAYVSVEDPEGKVLAHTDPAKVGQSGSHAVARDLSAAASYREVAAPMGGGEASGRPVPSVGQVRLGYLLETRSAVVAAPAETWWMPLVPLGLLLALAALAAVPMAVGLAALGDGARPPVDVSEARVRKIRSLRQARWALARATTEGERLRAQIGSQQEEAARLREQVVERTNELAQEISRVERLMSERAHRLTEEDRLQAEFAGQGTEIDHLRTALRRRVEEVEELQARSQRMELLEAEVARLRERQSTADGRSSPGPGSGTIDPQALEHQYRAVAYISQAIRRSLTNVLGFSKLLLRTAEDPLNESQRVNVLNIQAAGHHLLTVVNDLFELTQVEAGSAECSEETIDVLTLLRHTAEMGAVLGGQHDRHRKITVECHAPLPPLKADRRRVGQILLALIDPAPLSGDGEVGLSAHQADDRVALVVTRPKTVVPPDELSALFEPFPAVGRSLSESDDGSRLRLALAKSLVTLIGGSLVVESREGPGTTFTVTLPSAAHVPAPA